MTATRSQSDRRPRRCSGCSTTTAFNVPLRATSPPARRGSRCEASAPSSPSTSTAMRVVCTSTPKMHPLDRVLRTAPPASDTETSPASRWAYVRRLQLVPVRRRNRHRRTRSTGPTVADVAGRRRQRPGTCRHRLERLGRSRHPATPPTTFAAWHQAPPSGRPSPPATRCIEHRSHEIPKLRYRPTPGRIRNTAESAPPAKGNEC